MGGSTPLEYNLALLMNDVQRIRKQLTSSIPLLVSGNQTKFVYELAMGAVVSETVIHMPATCDICFDDDLEAEQMFSVALCGHQYCMECVKRHIEAKLLVGGVPRCPHYQCESNLTFRRCANLLSPKLKAMWERRIEEESILVEDRVYCPNPRCSTLMSETELSKSNQEAGGRRCCVKCGEPFCMNCKVPWHSNLSCNNYKRLGPNPTANDIKLIDLVNQKLWRQCGKCKHMIELSEGCIKLTCRCGYSFCYKCGTEWKQGGCRHRAESLICTLVVVFIVV